MTLQNIARLHVPQSRIVLYGIELLCLLYPLYSTAADVLDPGIYPAGTSSRFGPSFDAAFWILLWTIAICVTEILIRRHRASPVPLFAWNKQCIVWSLSTGIVVGGYALGVVWRLVFSLGDLYLHPFRVGEALYGVLIAYVLLSLRALMVQPKHR